jgi:mono/diheme cytochrome c family protein
VFVLLCGASGCGVNLEQIIQNALRATAQTNLDLLLTNLANELADATDADDSDNGDSDADGDGTDGDGTDGDGTDGDGTDGDGTDGDGSPDGAALFAANCAACHGADGATGFAPDITGATADDLQTGLMSASHGSIMLEGADIEALAVFLGGAAGSPTGDVAAGEAFFAGSGCGACHCADATGGCLPSAPSLIGVGADSLEANLVGDDPHLGGKVDASVADLADLAAFLGSL